MRPDPDAERVRSLHPGAVVWKGAATRSWWAMHPDVARLLEAATPDDLAALLGRARRAAAQAQLDSRFRY